MGVQAFSAAAADAGRWAGKLEGSMWQQLGLGLAVGVVISLMCWRGNQTPHLVSTFPDVATFVVMVILLSAAVWFDQRRQIRTASLQAGLTIAGAAGAVFGATVALLGTVQFTNPSAVLLAYGFVTAFGSSLVVGGAATLASSRWRHMTTA